MEFKQMIGYELDEKEIKYFLSRNYGIESKSGNRSIGKEIINTIHSFEIELDRQGLFAQRVKDITIKKLHKNKRLGNAVKAALPTNFLHQMILYEVNLFLFYRKNPEYLKYRK
jgi:hypothetical protein